VLLLENEGCAITECPLSDHRPTPKVKYLRAHLGVGAVVTLISADGVIAAILGHVDCSFNSVAKRRDRAVASPSRHDMDDCVARKIQCGRKATRMESRVS
jgi:hypothetical protein